MEVLGELFFIFMEDVEASLNIFEIAKYVANDPNGQLSSRYLGKWESNYVSPQK